MSGFWKFTNNYASRVTKILERSDFTLEKLLDEQETIPELLASNTKLVEYLRQPDVLEALVKYVVEDDDFQLEQQRLEEEESQKKMAEEDEKDSSQNESLELDQIENDEKTVNTTAIGGEEQDNERSEDNNNTNNNNERSEKEKDVETSDPINETDEIKKSTNNYDDESQENEHNEFIDEENEESKDHHDILDKEEEEGLIEAKEENPDDKIDIELSDSKLEADDSQSTSESDSDSDSDSDSEELGDLSANYDDDGFGDEMIMDEEDAIEETPSEQHSRRAQVSAEILSIDVWSLTDAFMENIHLIEQLWSILDKPAPLPIFSATYFMKINEHLLDMKMEEMILFILKQPQLVERFMRHIDTPPLMDFLLKVISTDKPDSSTGVIDVLKEQGLIPSLISYLGPDIASSVQSAAGDFLKAFITISANNSDNSTIGPNELSRELVSEPIIKELVKLMLYGGTGLSNGVGIIIEIIRKNNSDYDIVSVLDITVESHPPTSRDPIYLGTLVKVFADAIPEFRKMLERKEDKLLKTPFGEIEPLGFERFKICELFAELLHCSNMALLNEKKGEATVKLRDSVREALIKEQRKFFRDDDEEEEDIDDEDDEIEIEGEPESPLSHHTDDDISRDVGNLNLSPGSQPDENDVDVKTEEPSEGDLGNKTENEDVHEIENDEEKPTGDDNVDEDVDDDDDDDDDIDDEEEEDDDDDDDEEDLNYNMDSNELDLEFDELERRLRKRPVVGDQLKIALYDNNIIITILNMFFQFPWNNFLHNVVFDIVQQILGGSLEIGYNKYLVADLFGRGQITKFIVDGDKKCQEYEEESGLRLGYMGHLSLIAEEVVKFTSIYLPHVKSQIILDAVSLPEWTHYVNETLDETRNKYNAVLGDPKVENDEEIDDDYGLHRQMYEINDPNRPDGDLSLYRSEGHENDDNDIDIEEDNTEDNRSLIDIYNRQQLELNEDSDQFSRYMSQQITSDLPDKFGSSDEDEDEDDLNNWNNYDYQSNKYGTVSSSVGGQTYHEMGTFEPNDDDYEDPNDDGLSYAKDSHHLYTSDGLLSPVAFEDNKQSSMGDKANKKNIAISSTIKEGEDVVLSDSDSENSDNDEIVDLDDHSNELTRSASKSVDF